MKTQAVASECFSGLFPKNSLSGFKYCLSTGIDGVEFDIHLAADNQIIIQHDYFINHRITRDRQGNYLTKRLAPICQLTSQELAHFDIGRYEVSSREARDYPDYQPQDLEPIPTLAQFIDCYDRSAHQTILWIELKTSPYQRDISSDPTALLDKLLRDLEIAGLIEQSVLLAFEWDLLVEARQRQPLIQTDFLTINEAYIRQSLRNKPDMDLELMFGEFAPSKYQYRVADAISAAGGDWWGPFIKDVTKQDVEYAQSLGIKVNLWGVESSQEDIDLSLDMKADAITLARPDKLHRS